jgi:hypothetical protein
MKDEDLKLRSEQVQEILGLVPNWMIRWGNSLIFFLIIGLFFISWFIKYPDTITSEAILVTSNPIENIHAGVTGTFYEIKVTDQSRVSGDKVLAILNNDGIKDSLKTSVTGQIYFMDFWTIGSNVNKGDLVFRVVPSNKGALVGKITVPVAKAIKVCKGQHVRIRLSLEPNREYPLIEGTVWNRASLADEDGNIMVEVKIDEKWGATDGEVGAVKSGMTGTAEIVIEDLRLIERIFYQLRNIFKVDNEQTM